MALYHASDYLRTVPGGTAISGASITFKRMVDDTAIGSAVTSDANGLFQKSLSATATTGASSYELHPGPYYSTVTVNGVTRIHSSQSWGNAGAFNVYGLGLARKAEGNGLVTSPPAGLNTAAVAIGAGMTVTCATFLAQVEGVTVWNDAIRTLNVTAAHATLPRIDCVVLEVVPPGNALEGKATLKMVDGTPNASPVSPFATLTQTSSLWQLPISDVRTNGAATTPTSLPADRRTYILTGAGITRNQTMVGIGRYWIDPAVTISPAVTTTIPITTTVFLTNNVIYDIVAEGTVHCQADSTYPVQAYVYINGTGNISAATQHDQSSGYTPLPNSHTLVVTGTDATISCGMRINTGSGTGSIKYKGGVITVTAIPRS